MKSDLYAKMASHRVYTIKQQKSARPLNFTPIIYNNNNQSFRLTISIVKLAHPLFSFVSSFLSLSLFHWFEIKSSSILNDNSEFFSILWQFVNFRNSSRTHGENVGQFSRARGKAGIRGALSSRRCNSTLLDCQEFGMTYARRKLDSNL